MSKKFSTPRMQNAGAYFSSVRQDTVKRYLR
nr:MAG TPA: hypothetical protein [Caudoviricetes sp.]